MMFLGEVSFRVSGCESDEMFEEHIDEVLEHLYVAHGVIDPDYTATLAEHCVEFSLSVDAGDEVEALTLIYAALRTAIHTAYGSTPGWEEHFERRLTRIQSTSELVDA